MELREISLFEAAQNDLPASEPGEGELRTWYALSDEGKYKGFLETTLHEEDDITEITFFMIPDIYQGEGLGRVMLTLFLDSYIPLSTPEKMLTTIYEYNGEYGEAFSSIFSNHGFDISLRSFKEYVLPIETVKERLVSKKGVPYKGRMANLSECINEVLSSMNGILDSGITVTDVREAALFYSIAAFNSDDRMTALMLVSVDEETKDAVVTDLYTDSDDTTLLKKLFGFAAENALNAENPPANISFTAVNERLGKAIGLFFDDPRSSEVVMAEGEFNLGEYVELLKLESSREVR